MDVLRSADGIDLIEGSEGEKQDLTTRLEEAKAFGMEISAEESKIPVNSTMPHQLISSSVVKN